MKLRTRLMIAFLVVIFVPIALFCVVAVGFGKYQLQALEESMGVTDLTYESLSNSMILVSKSTQRLFEHMQSKAAEDADAFLDKDYLQGLNRELQSKSSFLVVRRGTELYFEGADGQIDILFSELPEYGDYTSPDGGRYIGRDVQAFVKQLDLTFTDGVTGSVFIITSVSDVLPQVKNLFRDMLVSTVIILFVTAAMLTYWIYRGVNNPLNRLREATVKIKEGNLDFTLEVEGESEIDELCRDFEDMRQRLKESAEEKAEYDRESKELISNISHDLKTPITAIKGYVEGIMDGVADTPEKMDRYIRTIYNKANDMDRLINELTLYSKIDTHRIPYTFNKINVYEYFADCAEEVGLELEERKIAFSYRNDVDRDVEIIADAEQLKRVINNIIGNSVKYMDKQRGLIQIRVKDAGDFIQVEIEDNGKGIAAKDLVSIFDRFYRTDASRNSAVGGSGIGLSLVKRIIEDHGGKIWARSKLGSGTTMYFVIRKHQEVLHYE